MQNRRSTRRKTPKVNYDSRATGRDINWSQFIENGSPISATKRERALAMRKARALKQLDYAVDYENDLDNAIKKVGVSKDEFYSWLSSERFAERLLRVAPRLSAKCLIDIIAVAEGSEGCSDVRLKANMELLRAFMPLVSKEIDFDSNTRKQKLANQGYLAGKVLTMKDQLKVLAKDPFIDYSEEIRRLREEPLAIEEVEGDLNDEPNEE